MSETGHKLPASVASDVDRLRKARSIMLDALEGGTLSQAQVEQVLDAMGDAESGLFYLSGKLAGHDFDREDT